MSEIATASRSPAQVEQARNLYRRIAPFYDGFRTLWSRWTREAEEELDRLFRDRIAPGARVLELAPGTGINIARVLRCAPRFGSYLGVDSSEEMLARARAKSAGDPRIVLRIGDATDLGDEVGCFDFVVCTWLLSHLRAPAEAALAASRHLAPGGTAVFLFLTAPDSAVLRWCLAPFVRLFRARFVDSRPFETLPGLEARRFFAGGMAMLAIVRTPGGQSVSNLATSESGISNLFALRERAVSTGREPSQGTSEVPPASPSPRGTEGPTNSGFPSSRRNSSLVA